MQSKADIYLSQQKQNNSFRERLRRSLRVLSLLVVLCVFWGLKLTGITMAGEAFCGIDEHVHTEECPLQTLICELEETPAHMHTEECLLKELICETAECEPHSHGFDCYFKTLECDLPEQDGHTHSEACQIRNLTCGQQEAAGHRHSDVCFSRKLICTASEEPAHSHGSGCYTEKISCGLEESEEHSHTDSCKTSQLHCTISETAGHSHGNDCYEESLVCPLEESDGHAHQDECYTIEEGYGCGLEQMDAHTHDESCYLVDETRLICTKDETEGHIHEDSCYLDGIGFGCGEWEIDEHVHTEACITEDTRFKCELEITAGHTHDETCYDILDSCPLEEHIHDESCYSDINADVETSDDWEMTLAGLTRSPRTADNIITVARAQLGYTESVRNFQIDANGVRRGINRFGQWYGNPYGDWSAMFASFCLYYAGVDVPANAGPESMRLEWDEAGLYIDAREFSPVPGHLIFLDKDGNGTADAVAVITGRDDTHMSVIEGDVPRTNEEGETVHVVAEEKYLLDDPLVMGYGMVPFEDELMLLPTGDTKVLGKTAAYNTNNFTNSRTFVIYTTSGGNNYAFDGSGNAVPVYIDAAGNISAEVADANTLLWTVIKASGNNNYTIKNLATGRYMHAYANNGGGVTTTNNYSSTLVKSGAGAKIRSNTEYARLDLGTNTFVVTQNQNQGAVFQFGMRDNYTVWLDGTNGGLMTFGGSPDEPYLVGYGDTMTLPEEWPSPEKYSYTLCGWYDVINNVYYQPGDEVVVTGNMVFYADWKASSYDIGRYNSFVSNTVSTNEFITTRVFDYGPLFNVLSSRAKVEVSASSHKETWSLITSGTNDYNGNETLNFIFRDWDASSELSYPSNINDRNTYTGNGIYRGIYSSNLRNLLFGTGTSVIGKHYIGTGDHLFQLMDDPSNEYYGYYYYNSDYHAASYNQSAQRFYVYDYLERTSVSAGSSDTGRYSDFLPLNSPYANTNGNSIPTYSYNGILGNYGGTTHYTYDGRYNTDGDSTGNVGTNFYFGMSVDVNFYLPNSPGTEGGNQDLYGNDMHFHFAGDDDVWILIDGQLVLDIGGIHGIEVGDINFTSGVVTANGSQTGSITHLAPGDHTLTILYLERGSSQSNCAIYFNLAPRFSFSIQKEDVLTRDVLNGAQFSVYLDKDCTVPAELWGSKASHDRGEPASNVFTVTGGTANMWGMGSGNTYYIKETKPPDKADYSFVHGIICVTIDKQGNASYSVELREEVDENGNKIPVSGGFTVHGFRVDEQTQQAYIIATNAPEWVKETTSIQARKRWADGKDHSGTPITVYLTVTDRNGTVTRLQEAVLSSANNWTTIWENMPKYWEDGVTPIQYGVQEAYVSGYYSTVEPVEGEYEIVQNTWQAVKTFENNKVYLLQNSSGQYLSTQRNASDTGYMWVSQNTALQSNLAQWTASVKNKTVRLTNKAGQTITFYYGNGSPTDFYAFNEQVEDNNRKQYLTFATSGNGLTLKYGNYFMANSLNNNQKFNNTTRSNQALVIIPYTEVSTTTTLPFEGQGFLVTNSPLETETSYTVSKEWNYGTVSPSDVHAQSQVTVKLLANGRDTGRTVTLSLKNGWKATFQGLPYTDGNGNVISYTVEESWKTDDWIAYYGEVQVNPGDPPTYSSTITNVYRWGTGALLPSTGSMAQLLCILCGASLMLTSLVFGIGSRFRRERRRKLR